MLNIIKIIKDKYNVNNLNLIYINNDTQLLEFNLNDFNTIKIYKNGEDYHLILSITNYNLTPPKKININLKYTYEKLLTNLEYFHFHFL